MKSLLKPRDVTVEQEDHDTFWIYLPWGYKMVDGEHAIVESTRRAALARLSDVERCDCQECSAAVK